LNVLAEVIQPAETPLADRRAAHGAFPSTFCISLNDFGSW